MALFFLILSCAEDRNQEKGEDPSLHEKKEIIVSLEQQRFIDTLALAKKMPLDSAVIYLDSIYQVALEKFGKQDVVIAKLLYRKGAQYFKAKEYEQAIVLFEQVKVIQKEIYPESHPDVSKIIHLLGEAQEALTQNETAISLYEEAARLRLKYNDSKLSKSYNKLGNIYREKGDLALAEKYLQLTLQHNTKSNPKTYHNLALVKYNLTDFKTAFVHLDSALKAYQVYPEHYKKPIVQCYTLKGSMKDDLEQYEEALVAYKKAIELLNNAENEDLIILHNLYNNLSITYKKLNKEADAIQFLEKSLRLKRETYQSDFHSSYTPNYNNLGDVFLGQKKFEKALGNYQLAIQNQTYPVVSKDIKKQIPLDNISITGIKTEFLTALFSKAKGLQTWSDYTQDKSLLHTALHTLESACQLIDIIRQEQSEEVSKLFWRAQTRPIYEKAIEVAYQLNQPKKAYEFFEKSKAALLLDALKSESANRFIPKDLAEKEKHLQKNLKNLEGELIVAKNQEEPLVKVIRAREELNHFVKEIETEYPEYFDARFNTDIATLTKVQEELKTKKASLIEYVLTEKYIYVLVVDEDLRLQQIPKPANFGKKIQDFVKMLSERNALESNQGFDNYLQIAQELHLSLIAPLELKNNRLTIVPDGILNYLPFEALVKDTQEQATPYLLRDYVINYAYSSSVLLQSKQVERQSNGQLLGIAPTQFPKAHLAPLDLSIKEVEEILSIIEGEKKVSKSATLSNFEKKASPYTVLHLSTHASASDTSQLHPWIAFYDSFLMLPEIYHLDLNADLVVLSACETSKGDFKTGEGVMSLARGFAYAGVPSTVTSLWEVNERATSEIMQHFYKNIQAHQPKDVALHQAKMTYLEQHPMSSPYFWAAFIPIGNTDALLNLSAP